MRLRAAEGIPNTRFTRSILRGALRNQEAAPSDLRGRQRDLFKTGTESSDWEPYRSSYISVEEADIRAAFEEAKINELNGPLLLIARENYNQLFGEAAKSLRIGLDEDLRVLLMPRGIDKMIAREKDFLKRYNLEFLRDSFYLWLSERPSLEPNPNTLLYPDAMILDYKQGNEAHKTHLKNFLIKMPEQLLKKD